MAFPGYENRTRTLFEMTQLDIEGHYAEINSLFFVGNSGTILRYTMVADLGNAVLGLKVLAGINTGVVYAGVDVNGDGRIGMDDVIWVLQAVAGIRQ